MLSSFVEGGSSLLLNVEASFGNLAVDPSPTESADFFLFIRNPCSAPRAPVKPADSAFRLSVVGEAPGDLSRSGRREVEAFNSPLLSSSLSSMLMACPALDPLEAWRLLLLLALRYCGCSSELVS